MAMEENEEVKKTVEVLDELSLSEEERELYEYRQKALLDEIDRIDYMSKKRFREGQEQTQIEIAKKMLSKNIPVEEIEEITGLTKEEIENLNHEWFINVKTENNKNIQKNIYTLKIIWYNSHQLE